MVFCLLAPALVSPNLDAAACWWHQFKFCLVLFGLALSNDRNLSSYVSSGEESKDAVILASRPFERNPTRLVFMTKSHSFWSDFWFLFLAPNSLSWRRKKIEKKQREERREKERERRKYVGVYVQPQGCVPSAPAWPSFVARRKLLPNRRLHGSHFASQVEETSSGVKP